MDEQSHRILAPMRAVVGDVPSNDDGWSYEVKWDGIRAIGFVEPDPRDGTRTRLRLQSSNGNDITARYPELAAFAVELSGHTAVLDGEIVAFNEDGRPDFGLLQERMHLRAERAAGAAARRPIVWVLFDLLALDGTDATGLPYEHRRRLLEELVPGGPHWQVPPAQRGDGATLLAAVAARGMEGLVAKRLGSTYEVGRRSAAWRKLKVRRRQELVVGGWKPGEGSRSGTIGALLTGYHTGDGLLAFAGAVGSGLRDADLSRLSTLLAERAIDACPFDPPPPPADRAHARWVRPDLVVEVAFAEWSRDGRLRHPSYVGLRDDKDPNRVLREPG